MIFVTTQFKDHGSYRNKHIQNREIKLSCIYGVHFVSTPQSFQHLLFQHISHSQIFCFNTTVIPTPFMGHIKQVDPRPIETEKIKLFELFDTVLNPPPSQIKDHIKY